MVVGDLSDQQRVSHHCIEEDCMATVRVELKEVNGLSQVEVVISSQQHSSEEMFIDGLHIYSQGRITREVVVCYTVQVGGKRGDDHCHMRKTRQKGAITLIDSRFRVRQE